MDLQLLHDTYLYCCQSRQEKQRVDVNEVGNIKSELQVGLTRYHEISSLEQVINSALS